MYEYLRNLYVSGSIGKDYLDIAVSLKMITESEKELILGSK